MFLKLLKYDMKSVFRLWWFVLPVLPVLVVLDAIAARVLAQGIADIITGKADELMRSLGEGMATIYVLAIIVSYLVFLGVTVLLSVTVFYTYFLVLYRFFKNLFTDEGYLTFTLPAKRSTVLLSKTVNSIFWITVHSLLLAAGGVFIFLFAIPTVDKDIIFGFTLFGELIDGFLNAVAESWGWILVIIVEGIICGFLSIIVSISIFHFCLTLGAIIVKKFKLVAGIGIYWLVQWILPFITTTLFYVLYFLFGAIFSLIAAMSGAFAMGAMLAVVIAMLCLFMIGEAHLFYFITRNCLERRLNLA